MRVNGSIYRRSGRAKRNPIGLVHFLFRFALPDLHKVFMCVKILVKKPKTK